MSHITTKGCTVHSSTSEYSATHHRARYSRVRDWEECIIYYILTAIWAMWNRPHEKSIRRLKGLRFFDRELQLSPRSKKSLFRQTFLLLIVRPSLDFLKRTDKILQVFFSEELVFKSRLFIFYKMENFKMERKRINKLTSQPRILEQSWCSILG